MNSKWTKLGLNDSQVIEMYKKMLLIRRFEERAAQEYGKGKIGGFCHLYIGQEAVAVGALSALNKNDIVFTSYRDHAQGLLKGIEPKNAMAELFGKFDGCSKGMGGSMHFYNVKEGYFGGWGIVGGHPPLAAGSAFASKYKNDKTVTICFLGEAAANQGVFHETLNMAQLWKLPVIFVIENNHYGMGTSIERAFSGDDLHSKGAVYGMEVGEFNGMDVLESYKRISEAVLKARNESLPTLLEAKTYRYRGHSMSDPGQYRSKEEIESYKKIDPLTTLKDEILNAKIWGEVNFENLEKEIKNLMQEAVEFADASPQPPMEVLYQNIYA